MPLRPINRDQIWLLPPTLDELIPDDHPARFVASFVDALDDEEWQKLKIEIEGELLGAPAYHPRCLLSVWLYGFMTGTRSSRKLEAACRDQMPYLWLTGWQHPDHNTLWRFYKEHRAKMRNLLKLTVKTAINMNLIDMAVQAVDGTKIGANASKDRTYDKKGLQRLLERTEASIREVEKENETGGDQPPIHLPENLRGKEVLRAEVKSAIEQVTKENFKNINLTDRDSKFMKNRQGILPGYNMQAMASPLKDSEKEKTSGMLITAADVVKDTTDTNQLIPMIKLSEEMTGYKADITLADAGYYSSINLAKCEQMQQIVAMPESNDKSLQHPYHKDKFSYNPDADTYTCPCGQILRFKGIKLSRKTWMRKYEGSAVICRVCKAFGICTKDYRRGRTLQIGSFDTALRHHRDWMSTDKARKVFKRRKELVEPVFGILKEQMGFRQFLLRGLNNVHDEAMLIAAAFNLRTLCHIWQAQVTGKRKILISILQRIAQKFDENVAFFVWEKCKLLSSEKY
jgi:transposase